MYSTWKPGLREEYSKYLILQPQIFSKCIQIIYKWVISEQLVATEEHELFFWRIECRIAGVTDFNSSELVHGMTSIFFTDGKDSYALNLEGEILWQL